MDNNGSKGGTSMNESNGNRNKLSHERMIHTELEQVVLQELNTLPKYSKFFEEYDSESVEEFKEYYAIAKAMVILDEGKALDFENQRQLKYQTAAEEYIWQIQQRKLFDLQIRWRAEQERLDEITVTAEFDIWSDKIEQCQFISSITQEEFDLYMSFIENSKIEDIRNNFVIRWQAYNDFKSQYLGEDDFLFRKPAWYEFYENKTGLSSLYLLEDKRGEKELFYKRIFYDYEMDLRKQGKKSGSPPDEDGRPWLRYYDNDMISKFVNECEDGNFVHKWNAYLNKFNIDNDIELNNAINILKSSTEEWGINYNEDWRQGIIHTAGEYERKKLLEALPKAYEDYLFRIKTGLAFNSHFEPQLIRDPVKEREAILNGRKLNGEPRDFNY